MWLPSLSSQVRDQETRTLASPSSVAGAVRSAVATLGLSDADVLTTVCLLASQPSLSLSYLGCCVFYGVSIFFFLTF